MDAKVTQVDKSKITRHDEQLGPDGSMPTFIRMAVAVSAIGYLANIFKITSDTGVSGYLREMGMYFPPMGILLGFM